jgi:two-component system alkaline phosphatase synthesis response regulator PhoP
MGAKIVLADDEPSIQGLLKVFLGRCGYQVWCAGNGQEAITIARDVLPDLIILDIQMPVKTGVEVVQELRQDAQFAQTPIIAISAFARDYGPEALLKIGFNVLLAKPFELAELGETVATLLKTKALPASDEAAQDNA